MSTAIQDRRTFAGPPRIRRGVHFVSRKDAESMTPDAGCAVVSITDPCSAPATLQDGWMDVLRLEFHDVNPDITGAMMTYQHMSPEQAALTVSFIRSAVVAGARSLLVHCEAGISRSAAVAVWARDDIGWPMYAVTPYMPNTYVLRLLNEARRQEVTR